MNISITKKFSDVSIHQKRIGSDSWKVFPFFSYGTINEENCKKAPFTSKLLLSIPSIRLAMYSVLDGPTIIPLHCGFLKSVLRVHLTLLCDNRKENVLYYF